MRGILSGMLLARAMSTTTLPAQSVPLEQSSEATPFFDEQILFKTGTHGYNCFRIPAIVRAEDGTLLDFAEGRVRDCGDAGDIDLVLRRSTDGGQTWGPIQMVAEGHGDTRGNPAPIVDANIGRVVLRSTFNPGNNARDRRPFVHSSDDHGATWSAPRELTAQISRPEWNRWYATGPVHGIQLKRGPHAERMVVGVNYINRDGTREIYGAALVYSDDGGSNWQIGATSNNHVSACEEQGATTMLQITRLFAAGDGGYSIFRIPAIVATQLGTLLVFCAARRGRGGDWDSTDIVMRRSSDGGATWDEPRLIAPGGQAPADNPTPIVDYQTGAIHFLHQVNYERCYYLRSGDDGLSWSAPRDITEEAFEPFRPEYPWRVLAPGPGHAIQLRTGRLVVPIWLSTGGETTSDAEKLGHRPSAVSVIYSDDHGATWRRGEIVVNHSALTPNPSETVAVQLHDGRVMLSIRNESPRYRRLVSFSADGATGWSEPQFHEELYDPICMASMVRFSAEPHDKNPMLFVNPDSSASDRPAVGRWGARPRENLSIKVSFDEGASWPVNKVIDQGVAGYSDLAIGPDGTIYCVYEGGSTDGSMFRHAHLSIARFDLQWLTGEEG